jgi:hypothetical protein
LPLGAAIAIRGTVSARARSALPGPWFNVRCRSCPAAGTAGRLDDPAGSLPLSPELRFGAAGPEARSSGLIRVLSEPIFSRPIGGGVSCSYPSLVNFYLETAERRQRRHVAARASSVPRRVRAVAAAFRRRQDTE